MLPARLIHSLARMELHRVSNHRRPRSLRCHERELVAAAHQAAHHRSERELDTPSPTTAKLTNWRANQHQIQGTLRHAFMSPGWGEAVRSNGSQSFCR